MCEFLDANELCCCCFSLAKCATSSLPTCTDCSGTWLATTRVLFFANSNAPSAKRPSNSSTTWRYFAISSLSVKTAPFSITTRPIYSTCQCNPHFKLYGVKNRFVLHLFHSAILKHKTLHAQLCRRAIAAFLIYFLSWSEQLMKISLACSVCGKGTFLSSSAPMHIPRVESSRLHVMHLMQINH